MALLRKRHIAVLLVALVTLVAIDTSARGDVVTLTTGSTVHGNLVSPPSGSGVKSVALITSSGGLIVFDHTEVKQIKRGADPAQKSASGKSTGKKQLTAAEKAWIPKIRSLLKKLASEDRDLSRRARVALLDISDPDAIPALTQYLRKNPDEELRRLYVTILGNIRSTKVIYHLVDQSLFDPSPQVRDDARKAIGEDRADLARPLYIHALRLGDADLASRAALALAEIGDPRGEAVPYLIDDLVAYVSKPHQIVPAGIGVVDMMTLYTTPGYVPTMIEAPAPITSRRLSPTLTRRQSSD